MLTAFCVFALLTGCDGSPNREHREHSMVGRYQYYPASADMPAMLLDTTTGCIEHFVKLTSKINPQDVTWATRYVAVGLPTRSFSSQFKLPTTGSTDEKASRYPLGTRGSTDDLTPPLRCKEAGSAKK
jgi:hypothetical protein